MDDSSLIPTIAAFPSLRAIELRRMLGLGLLILVVSGCGSTHHVSHRDTAAYRQVERAAAGRTARVHLRGGLTLRLDELSVTPDSVAGISPEGRRRAVPTSAVLRVELFDPGSGALKGAGIGAAVPIGIGGIAAAVSGSVYEGFWNFMGGIAASLPGALLGTLVGAVRANREVYRFPAGSEDASSDGTTGLRKRIPQHAD